MKNSRCVCAGEPRLFFEDRCCTQCDRSVGFDVASRRVIALEPGDAGCWHEAGIGTRTFKLCRNTEQFGNCNWLVPAAAANPYCTSCQFSRTIPNLTEAKNLERWAVLEQSKRRVLYALLRLELPLVARARDPEHGLCFDFLEDRRSNPLVAAQRVSTGHADGVITVNLIEADEALRTAARLELNEVYRTPLGHMRHETGHYYFSRLLEGTPALEHFRAVFGEEREDYNAALDRHYQLGPRADWQTAYISAYGASHPLEDWAESWAHYLHMFDALETAIEFKVVPPLDFSDFDTMLLEWYRLSVTLNALNRSLGLNDAYPFVLSAPVTTKLRFIHDLIRELPAPS